MAELVVLDPDEVAGDRVELDITNWVAHAGPDWGDASIEAYLAEAERGQLPVDYRVPNRTIQIPLVLKDVGVEMFDEIRRKVQAKAALFQREGGFLKRHTDVGPGYYDVIGATLRFGGSTFAAFFGQDTDAVLTLECIPDMYGDWREVTSGLGSGDLSLTAYDVPGDYPARVRVDVGNGTANAQRGLIFGARSRNHDAADTAEFAYDPSGLNPLDASTTFGSAVIHASLSTSWTPIFSTAIATVDQMTHRGTYRVWVRVSTSSAVPPQLRLVWDVGDLALPAPNAPQAIPTSNNSHLINLGEVRLDPPPLGDHRWGGVVQARGAAGGEQVAINRIYIIPADDCYMELRASASPDIGLGGFSARDEFNQTAGNLSGKTAPVGGNWASTGDADDFTINATGHWVERAALSDTLTVGRYAVSGVTAMGATVAQVDVAANRGLQAGPNQRLGVMARYTDANNWLMATIGPGGVGASTQEPATFELRKRVGGTIARLALVELQPWAYFAGYAVTIKIWVDTGGNYTVWIFQTGAVAGAPYIVGRHADLATGGALASGKPGFYDEYPFAAGTDDVRFFDNFAAWVPDPDAVVFGSQDCELRTDGIVREDLFGIGFSPVSHVVGGLPRCPPSGLEGRPVEMFLKVSRGDLGSLPDPADDGFGAIVYVAPSWLQVPGG